MKRDLPAALAQSHNTVTVSSRAIDVGYANTKFTVGRKKVNGETVIVADLFPSITAVLPKGRPFERKAGTRASDGCLTEIDGVLHFAGRGVPMHLKGSQPRHVLPNYCMTPAYMALMHAAMHYMLEDVGNPRELVIEHLGLGLPLNTHYEYKEKLRQSAIGTHVLGGPEDPLGVRTVRVLDADVMVQPLGALMNYGMANKGAGLRGWSLVVDVGGGTIDYLVSLEREPNHTRSGAHPESMLQCAYAVAQQINPSYQNNFTVIEAIDAAIRTRSATVRIAGVDLEMADYKGTVDEVLRRGYDAMLSDVGDLSDFDTILVCGGGGSVFYDFLCEVAPELKRRLKCDPGSAFSNVRGFQLASEFVSAQGMTK